MTRPAAMFGVGMVCGAFLAAGTLFIATTTDVRPQPDCETVLVSYR